MELIKRPRRLRGTEHLRRMVRETRMDKSSLVYPMFVTEGSCIKEEIPSMPGQYRYSLDRMEEELSSMRRSFWVSSTGAGTAAASSGAGPCIIWRTA